METADIATRTKEEIYQQILDNMATGEALSPPLNQAELIIVCGIISDELAKINKHLDDAFERAAADLDIDMTTTSIGGVPLGGYPAKQLSAIAAKSGGGRSINLFYQQAENTKAK